MEFELIDLVFLAESILSLLEVWGVFGIVLGIEVAVKLPYEDRLLLPLAAAAAVLVFRVIIPELLLVELFTLVTNSIEVDTPRLDR